MTLTEVCKQIVESGALPAGTAAYVTFNIRDGYKLIVSESKPRDTVASFTPFIIEQCRLNGWLVLGEQNAKN